MQNPVSIKNKKGEILLAYKNNHQNYDKAVQAALEYAAANKISLKGADLRNLNFKKANFAGLDLEGANLSGTTISDSNLDGCCLFKANLSDGHISNTSMQDANLDLVILNRSVLTKTSFARSSMISASLVASQIRECDFTKCRAPIGIISLEGTFIYRSNFTGAVLNNPYLSSAIILKSNFKDADLIHGQYQHTKFNQVDFDGTRLQLSNGQFTEFTNSPLDKAEIIQCHLSHFKINDHQYGKFSKLKDIAEHLAEIQPMYMACTTPDQIQAMYQAIKDRDQQQINQLRKEHQQALGESNLFDMQGFDFSDMNLSGLNLNKIDFSGSDFSGAQLDHSSFDHGVLDGAIFCSHGRGASHGLSMKKASGRNLFLNDFSINDGQFSGMDLSYSRMDHVLADVIDLNSSNLYSASFNKKTKLDYANFDHSNLHHVVIQDTEIHGQFNFARIHSTTVHLSDLSGSELTNCDMSNSNFTQSNMTGVNLHGTSPRYCNLKGSDLSSSKLSGSHFTYFNFTDSDLSGTDLSYCHFKNCLLSNVDVAQADVEGVIAIDTKIDKTDVDTALNLNDSVKLAAGIQVEHAACSSDEAKAHLDRLKALLRDKKEKEQTSDFGLVSY